MNIEFTSLTAESMVCEKCGQTFHFEPIMFDGRKISVRPICDACEKIEEQERIQAEREKRQQKALHSWHELCPPRYQNTDPNDPRISQVYRKALASWDLNQEGIGIGLMGHTGKGKTRLMYWRLLPLFMAGHKIVCTSSVAIERAIHKSFSDDRHARWEAEDLIESARYTKILFLDDIGKEKFTERVASQFYDLIEYRTNQMLHTVWTTNTSAHDLKERLGEDKGGPIVRRLKDFSKIVED